MMQARSGWTVEMRVDLSVIGYDITQAAGDIIMLNWHLGL
jgi:hypothetical protein